MLVSFCIPTLNRPEYLKKTLESICNDTRYASKFEICIYNNCSKCSYEAVEAYIDSLSKIFNLKYVKGADRLSIDESMLQPIKMANGEYLFFIGDDDYLDPDGLINILQIAEQDNFDLIICNATLVNEGGDVVGQLIGNSNKIYLSLGEALVELKKYCAYGNILIKSKYILEEDFTYLIGTSHAYGCFWLYFFKEYEAGISPRIYIPEPSIVNLRLVKKNYDLFEVIFKDADIEHQLYFDIIGKNSEKILRIFEKNFWKMQTNIVQLLKFRLAGYDLKMMGVYNKKFYYKYKYKIYFVNFISIILRPLKKTIKNLLMVKSFISQK